MKVLIDIQESDLIAIKNAAKLESRSKKKYIERIVSSHAKTITPLKEIDTEAKALEVSDSQEIDQVDNIDYIIQSKYNKIDRDYPNEIHELYEFVFNNKELDKKKKDFWLNKIKFG